jgi:hypothetical protein
VLSDGKERAVRHRIPFYGLQWMLALLILPGLARLQGQGGAESSPPVLEVRWISDSSDGNASAHIELTARYEIRDVHMLKWVAGSLDKSEASFEGRQAAYEYVSPAAQLGDGPPEVLSSLLEEAGATKPRAVMHPDRAASLRFLRMMYGTWAAGESA